MSKKKKANLEAENSRGGVEDTRLEAKAKDTKKIRGQGQGQPFRGQTLTRPRTGMLEAKAKDQGHKAKCSPKKKKKGLHKNFSGDLQKKKGLHKNFSGDLQKKKKKKRSSQKFFKQSPLKDVFQNFFQALHKILAFQKIVLSSSRGQANFRGLQASRPRPRTSKCVLEDSTSGKQLGRSVIVLMSTIRSSTCCKQYRFRDCRQYTYWYSFLGGGKRQTYVDSLCLPVPVAARAYLKREGCKIFFFVLLYKACLCLSY